MFKYKRRADATNYHIRSSPADRNLCHVKGTAAGRRHSEFSHRVLISTSFLGSTFDVPAKASVLNRAMFHEFINRIQLTFINTVFGMFQADGFKAGSARSRVRDVSLLSDEYRCDVHVEFYEGSFGGNHDTRPYPDKLSYDSVPKDAN